MELECASESERWSYGWGERSEGARDESKGESGGEGEGGRGGVY